MPNQKSPAPPDELRQMIYYEDGNLYWYPQYHKYRRTEKPIGSVNKDGYRRTRITIDKVHRDYQIHRLVWWLINDEWPDYLDHLNNNRLDNRIENLRTATKQQNAFNRRPKYNNPLGLLGVEKQRNSKLYKVRIYVDGNNVEFTGYKTKEAAALARDLASIIFFGDFANFNILDHQSISIDGHRI
ncbi:HNH endonuclease [Salmonella enterica subsp. enterica serovar Ibadan]|nr:HNH endonuclease [Salmonella enterica subsp. enterica serovar Ibadan]ECF3282119.1 HNH endonuclease [Salmonella enterica subsp. enterica serovar Ibadan]